MADKKNHHYVPQFYLRGFSLKGSGGQVALYHIPKGIYVPDAPIKSQACGNNFYKSLKIEDWLANMERAASTVIRGIITNERVPTLHSPEHYCLLVFCLIQSARTPWQAEEISEWTNQFVKLQMMASGEPIFRKHLDKIKVDLDNPIGVALEDTAFTHHVAYDLRFKVLVNETEIPFITSDNPTILYNQFLERRRNFGSNAGLAVKGLQIFFPLSPRLCLMFFDGDVYRVGGRRLTHIFERMCEHDVYQLNWLQVVSAYENLYFNERCSSELARKIVRKALQWRRDSKTQMDTYVSPTSLGKQGVWCHTYNTDIRTGLKLAIVEELPSVKNYQLGTNLLRNPDLYYLHQVFLRQVEHGKYTQPSQFIEFLLDIGPEKTCHLVTQG